MLILVVIEGNSEVMTTGRKINHNRIDYLAYGGMKEMNCGMYNKLEVLKRSLPMSCSDPRFALHRHGNITCAVDHLMDTYPHPETSSRCLIGRVVVYPIIRKRSERWY